MRYHIVGKFGKFGESFMIRQTKAIQTSIYNYNLLAESIHSPNFFCQMLETSKFTKLYPSQTFPLYGIWKFDTLFSIIYNKKLLQISVIDISHN